MEGANLKVDDWSGGFTDHYLNGPLNRSRVLDNFLINRNRKPLQRSGSVIYDVDYYQIPTGNSRINMLAYFDSRVFYMSNRAVFYVDAGWQTLTGPTGNPVFSVGDINSQISYVEWQKHLIATNDSYSQPVQLYKDGGGTYRANTMGLPDLGSDFVVTPTAGGTAQSYIYGLCYKYTYYVGTVEYVVRGPVRLVTKTGTFAVVGVSPWNLSGIASFTNGATLAYDTANIKVEIYRTTNGGVDLKYSGQVNLGTTTYADNVLDANLGINIYTNGDVSDNDPPPPAKYVIQADGVFWYLNVKEDGQEKGYRCRQALKDQPYSCPGVNYVDADSDVTGGGVVDIYPIVFTKTKAFRFEGYVDNQGNGFTRKRIISRTVGCISHNSIVAVLGGLYFAGVDGFYFTDGYRVIKVSNHLNESYRLATETEVQQKRIHGVLDPVDQRVYWTMTPEQNDVDVSTLWVLDQFYGMSAESTFTTWSSGDDFIPTSIMFIGGDLIRSDRRGYTFQHNIDYYTDPVIDLAEAPADWITKAVVYDYTSVAYSFGTDILKKFIPKITVVAKNLTNLSLLCQSINDDSAVPRDLLEIRFRDNFEWGDPELTWGDETLSWNFAGTILAERMFPKGTLRCIYKQVRMTNANTIVAGSDDYGTGAVDTVLKTVLLDDAVTFDWPLNIEGYAIYFESDGYEAPFPIVSRSDDTLIVTEGAGALPVDGSYRWIIKGIRKGERLSLEGYSLNYEVFGESTRGYDVSGSGANA